jgi:hypothetical protein
MKTKASNEQEAARLSSDGERQRRYFIYFWRKSGAKTKHEKQTKGAKTVTRTLRDATSDVTCSGMAAAKSSNKAATRATRDGRRDARISALTRSRAGENDVAARRIKRQNWQNGGGENCWFQRRQARARRRSFW